MRQETRDKRQEIAEKKQKKHYKLFRFLLYSLFIIHYSLICFSCQSEEKIKHEQYYIAGKELFEANCANCHQKNGGGLQNLYPPINEKWLLDKPTLVCIIKNGLGGEITVNGKKFNEKMPPAKNLYALDIAQIVTYLDKEFADKEKITETQTVETAIEKCK